MFRHYSTPEGARSIAGSGRLRNGPLAYILEALDNVWRVFDDYPCRCGSSGKA